MCVGWYMTASSGVFPICGQSTAGEGPRNPRNRRPCPPRFTESDQANLSGVLSTTTRGGRHVSVPRICASIFTFRWRSFRRKVSPHSSYDPCRDRARWRDSGERNSRGTLNRREPRAGCDPLRSRPQGGLSTVEICGSSGPTGATIGWLRAMSPRPDRGGGWTQVRSTTPTPTGVPGRGSASRIGCDPAVRGIYWVSSRRTSPSISATSKPEAG